MKCTKCNKKKKLIFNTNCAVFMRQLNPRFNISLCQKCAIQLIMSLLDLTDMDHYNQTIQRYGKEM